MSDICIDYDRVFCEIHDGILLDSHGICSECWQEYLNTLHTGKEPVVLDQLQRECGSWARSKNYRTDKDTVESKLLMLYSEITEAVEEYRNHHPVTELYYNNSKPEGVGVELADEIIRILEFCDWVGIDMAEMIRLKMAYNWTRVPRNGDKLI